jgi:hypothetical protein
MLVRVQMTLLQQQQQKKGIHYASEKDVDLPSICWSPDLFVEGLV